jgi:pimeloyl-ACP methyl ester carboxylesterase/predicted ester cyclase
MNDSKALPLALAPGTLCDERLFQPLITALRLQGSDRQVVMLPAWGASSTAELAATALAAAPARFALLGFSLGGIIALEMAAQAPARIAGLALIASNARPAPIESHAKRRADVAIARNLGVARYVQEHLWPHYVAEESLDNEALRRLIVEMAETFGVETLAEQVEAAIGRADSRPRLSSLRVPTLLICGAEDRTCTVEMHEEMAQRLPDACLSIIPHAGHFALLEKPQRIASDVSAWLDRIDALANQSATPTPEFNIPYSKVSEIMSKTPTSSEGHKPEAGATDDPSQVLQVERRDFVDLVPENRPRVQSMRGFDDCYTDIVDYIVRCTHKIWDERDIGLIYSHYTHNCVVYGTLGAMYERESIVRETIQRVVELPDRRGMATQVIWRGNDVDGFYTSHLTQGTGRHTEYGMYGRPTGRTFVTRTFADCMILENKIYREWVVRDNVGLLVQLGIDPVAYAETIALQKFERGETVLEISENRRLLGQYPPESEPDLSLAHNDQEVEVLRWLHHIFNKRMFGKISEIYAPQVQWHGPLMRELYGVAAVLQETMRLVALIPDCAYVPQHICSIASEEGGVKVAVRWVMDGHHFGYGALGPPTGHRLFVMGMTHYHIVGGKIVEEWTIYDQLSMLVQLKLTDLQRAA